MTCIWNRGSGPHYMISTRQITHTKQSTTSTIKSSTLVHTATLRLRDSAAKDWGLSVVAALKSATRSMCVPHASHTLTTANFRLEIPSLNRGQVSKHYAEYVANHQVLHVILIVLIQIRKKSGRFFPRFGSCSKWFSKVISANRVLTWAYVASNKR